MIARIQAQLRASAETYFTTVAAPPFTCFFNPDSASPYANYAIPNGRFTSKPSKALANLRTVFANHQRQPRFEFLADFAPELALILQQNGFVAEDRTQLMVCTPETFRPVLPSPELSIHQIVAADALDIVKAFVTVQRRAFGGDDVAAATEQEAVDHWARYGRSPMFLACHNGQAVGVGSLTHPFDNLVEVAGIGTLAAFRGMGVGTAVTSHATQSAIDQGTDTIFLTAADARAGRIYEHVGFKTVGFALAYGETRS